MHHNITISHEIIGGVMSKPVLINNKYKDIITLVP